jgi:hypothetical protein
MIGDYLLGADTPAGARIESGDDRELTLFTARMAEQRPNVGKTCK